MRFVLAISALVLSGVLLILGVGQTTFLAGPKVITANVDVRAESGLATIPAEAVSAVQGQANVVLTGVDPVISIGFDRDVAAWAAPFGYLQFEVDAETQSLKETTQHKDFEASSAYALLIEAEEGQPLVPPSAVGSDLWLEQRFAEVPDAAANAGSVATESDAQSEGDELGSSQPVSVPSTVRMPLQLSADQAVLLAVDPQDPAMQVSLEWVQDRRTPLAGPLLAAGGLFAVLGIVLYLFAVDHDRRGLGPRRGRKGPLLGIRNVAAGMRKGGNAKRSTASSQASGGETSSKRIIALPALGLALMLGLSGCSPSYWPDFAEQPDEAEVADTGEVVKQIAPVPITQSQIDRILAEVVALSNDADDQLKAAPLKTRFTGDALVERTTNYKIRAKVKDYEIVVPRITDEALGYQLVQSTEGWPRTIFMVVASSAGDEVASADADDSDAATEDEQPAESPSLALILRQTSPHENYMVTRSIALRGGITMPEAAPADEGTALLANDVQTLVLPPNEVGDAYGAVLAGGTEVEEAAFFEVEGDTLIERTGAAWVARSTAAAKKAGQGIKYSVKAVQSDSKAISLSTGTGGALVAVTVQETRTERPDAGGRWRPTVPKPQNALSGLSGQQNRLISVVSHQLLFYVPSSTVGGQVQVLGFSSDLIAARK